MDDPQHHDRRDNNLHDFRKFTRTRSFTDGDHQPQARSAQPCQPINFAGGAGAMNRRVTSVKEEDDVNMMSPSGQKGKQLVHDWDSPGDSVDGSPCARYLTADMPMRDSAQPIFGSTKSRAIGNRALGSTQGKRTFLRTASYAGPVR
jgi:M-phase inducer tyrosine phosphatase